VMSTVLGRLGHDRFWAVYDAVNAEKERRADSTL